MTQLKGTTYWGTVAILVGCLLLTWQQPGVEAQSGLPPQHGGLGFGGPGGTFTGGTITTPILAPAAGNCASVPYSFTGDTNTGLCSSAADTVVLQAGGESMVVGDPANNAITFSPSPSLGYTAAVNLFGYMLPNTGAVAWSSTNHAADGTPDVLLYRDAAGRMNLRNGTNAQQLAWSHTYTDASNYQGGVLKTSASGIEIAAETAGSGADNLNVTITPAGSGYIVVNGAITSPTYIVSTQHHDPISTDTFDLGNAIGWRSAWIIRGIQGSKTKALTEGAATAVTQIAVPQTAGSNSADAVVQWTVYASDGTDTQTRRGSTYLAAVNKAGTETCTVGDIGTPVVAVSAGTLTCTTSCITGLTDVVQFALDCTSSLTQTSLNALVRLDMDQPNTVTPQ